jgi:hypothetical protein
MIAILHRIVKASEQVMPGAFVRSHLQILVQEAGVCKAVAVHFFDRNCAL